MAKLLRIDRKLRTVGGKLVTDANGAPCCCGGGGGECCVCDLPTAIRTTGQNGGGGNAEAMDVTFRHTDTGSNLIASCLEFGSSSFFSGYTMRSFGSDTDKRFEWNESDYGNCNIWNTPQSGAGRSLFAYAALINTNGAACFDRQMGCPTAFSVDSSSAGRFWGMKSGDANLYGPLVLYAYSHNIEVPFFNGSGVLANLRAVHYAFMGLCGHHILTYIGSPCSNTPADRPNQACCKDDFQGQPCVHPVPLIATSSGGLNADGSFGLNASFDIEYDAVDNGCNAFSREPMRLRFDVEVESGGPAFRPAMDSCGGSGECPPITPSDRLRLPNWLPALDTTLSGSSFMATLQTFFNRAYVAYEPCGLAPPGSRPEPPQDPRIAATLDQQARGGGCRGCGDGFTG